MENTTDPTVALSLTVKDASKAIEFYTNAFGAQEVFRMPSPDGGVAHAEFMIGNTHLYISDEAEDWHAFAMPPGTTASCLFSIAIDNCDDAFQKATSAGAETLNEPIDYFWGTRSAMVKDPFGYRWSLNQQIEEVSPEEMARRAEAFFTSGESS